MYPYYYNDNNIISTANNYFDYINAVPDYYDRQVTPPIVSNPPASASIALRKELNAYPNYGNPSGNADILYTGSQGTWTFNLPAFLFVPGQLARSELVISGVLDDHYGTAENLYTMSVFVNGQNVFNGRPPFVHGRPQGQIFNNWRIQTLPIRNLRRNNTITIRNTSNARPADWIGFDWMELRIIPRTF